MKGYLEQIAAIFAMAVGMNFGSACHADFNSTAIAVHLILFTHVNDLLKVKE
ncbi:hypothetical protein [Marinospirillum perlucidum]|uniref:hypothetical protein n=1 Tax=Marinospirillum perlucidum TaxID=1982602 RepID=UPI001390380D|nr:hypothetical protein [Marinospirillum perlucidum]